MSSGGSAFMARQLSSPWQRDEGSNPPPSSRESANFRFRCGHDVSNTQVLRP